MNRHLSDCPEQVIACKCCNEKMKRKEKIQHKSKCLEYWKGLYEEKAKKTMKKCEFCAEKVPVIDLDTHHKNCAFYWKHKYQGLSD